MERIVKKRDTAVGDPTELQFPKEKSENVRAPKEEFYTKKTLIRKGKKSVGVGFFFFFFEIGEVKTPGSSRGYR